MDKKEAGKHEQHRGGATFHGWASPPSIGRLPSVVRRRPSMASVARRSPTAVVSAVDSRVFHCWDTNASADDTNNDDKKQTPVFDEVIFFELGKQKNRLIYFLLFCFLHVLLVAKIF